MFKQISTILNVSKNFIIFIYQKSKWYKNQKKIYENGEQSTKYFLNLEKYRATQNCLRTVIVNKENISNYQQINDGLYNYQTLYKEKLSISEEFRQSFFVKVSLPKLNENQIFKCEGAITEYELLKVLTSMDSDK